MSKKYNFYLIIIIFSIALASCKTHERCPAYGKINSKNNSNIPA